MWVGETRASLMSGAASVGAPSLSIVTPTYQRRQSVLRLLDALRSQSFAADRFEVIVIDDGSSDGTAEAVRALSTPYALTLLQQSHRGPAAARNLGVDSARAPIILFLDDDVVPGLTLVAMHAAAHAAPSTVVVGPMNPPVRPRAPWIRWEEEKLDRQYRAMLAGVYPCTPRQFFTGNASVERAAFLDAGGFDPGFERAEDVELAYRLQRRGARFEFLPAAEVLHHAQRSLASWSRASYYYGRADVMMDRDKGHDTLPAHLAEFRKRHQLSRVLTRLTVGRPVLWRPLRDAFLAAARIFGGLGWNRAAGWALSAASSLLYWQGAADELGGRDVLWRMVDGNAATHSAGPKVRGHLPAGPK
jgi:GT2 family glycosyltransferase